MKLNPFSTDTGASNPCWDDADYVGCPGAGSHLFRDIEPIRSAAAELPALAASVPCRW